MQKKLPDTEISFGETSLWSGCFPLWENRAEVLLRFLIFRRRYKGSSPGHVVAKPPESERGEWWCYLCSKKVIQ